MDVVARLVLDLALHSPCEEAVLNVEHPQPVEWKDIIRWLNLALAPKYLEVISGQEWISRLKSHSDDIAQLVCGCGSGFIKVPDVSTQAWIKNTWLLGRPCQRRRSLTCIVCWEDDVCK